jgi:hypothetical protein
MYTVFCELASSVVDPHCFNADWNPYPAFASMRIRIVIQGEKPIWIHADPDPDQPLPSLKVNFYVNNMFKVCKES